MNSNQMSYSREFLQNVPQQRIEQTIDSIINNFQNNLLNTAALGETKYCYEITENKPKNNLGGYPQVKNPWPTLNIDDLIAGFQKRFPDCKVYYEEKWIETSPQWNQKTSVLKKGIWIDWS